MSDDERRMEGRPDRRGAGIALEEHRRQIEYQVDRSESLVRTALTLAQLTGVLLGGVVAFSRVPGIDVTSRLYAGLGLSLLFSSFFIFVFTSNSGGFLAL
ncbi:hypothetical protein [Halomarina pelagica]|uniref:hypothetical protein n=1 Tax=Halomarina pelagica TaxID=2961599 RepID=UPI0020C32B6A|nr:hypothetical protein [Halomarina sp. BND7]